jgi:chromosome segregation ATPase
VDEAELMQLREQIDAANATAEQLRYEAAERAASMDASSAENERLRAELAAATDAASSLDADVAAMRQELESAEARLLAGAAKYRAAVLDAEPWLAPELVTGGTIDEVEASAQRARDVAAFVRGRMEEQANTARVPAGAPSRGGPDVSAMTPEQKIRYGLAQRERA